MSIVHISTHVNGGAGNFCKMVHSTMNEGGISSLLITRETNDLEHAVVLKPQKRYQAAFNLNLFSILEKLGLAQNKYALFGIGRSPVRPADIRRVVGPRWPRAIIFYWVSYFVNFHCMSELRRLYPNVPFLFICLDEAFLTGGCHYSWGCGGYIDGCGNCPATAIPSIKSRVKKELRQRKKMISAIDPIVLYPTTELQRMGKRSEVLKSLRSKVVPLGGISEKERYEGLEKESCNSLDFHSPQKTTFLVRSSREYRKGCDLFADAIKKVSDLDSKLTDRLRVVSIGDDALKKMHIDRHVEHLHLGIVNRAELMAVYRKVDALIVTSREDAGPIVINECVALGKYVISTPVGVANDIIKNKFNGIILRDISSDALRDAMFTFLKKHHKNAFEKRRYAHPVTNEHQLTFEGYTRTLVNTINEYLAH